VKISEIVLGSSLS